MAAGQAGSQSGKDRGRVGKNILHAQLRLVVVDFYQHAATNYSKRDNEIQHESLGK